CISAFSFGPVLTCLCASMNPGIAVMPLASIVRPLAADGAPAVTDTIFPPRTTIDPRSITVPLATMIRALVIVRSCADARVSAAVLSCFPSQRVECEQKAQWRSRMKRNALVIFSVLAVSITVMAQDRRGGPPPAPPPLEPGASQADVDKALMAAPPQLKAQAT